MIKVAFDIDGCLINTNNTPNYPIIDLYRAINRGPVVMYIWSGCGVDYAKQWKEKLGLGGVVVAKGSEEVDIAFDDQEVNLGKVNIRV